MSEQYLEATNQSIDSATFINTKGFAGIELVESPTTVVLSPVDPVVAITRAGDTFSTTLPQVTRALYTGLDSDEAHVIYRAAGQLFVVTGNLAVSLVNAAYQKIKGMNKS